MRRHQHRRTVAAQPLQKSVDEEEARWIQVTVGFVEEHDLRGLLEDAGERQSLAHPRREGLHRIVAAIGEPDLLEAGEEIPAHGARAEKARGEGEVLQRRQWLV